MLLKFLYKFNILGVTDTHFLALCYFKYVNIQTFIKDFNYYEEN